MESIHRYSVNTINGEKLALSSFSGKPFLIVNIASKCIFASQLNPLEKLYQEYRTKGFEILAFPCNQFGKKEPLNDDLLVKFYKKHFDISFTLCEKSTINGPDAHPAFNFLKSHTRGVMKNRVIKWNFTKFLINSQGQLISRYAPRTKPSALKPLIEAHLTDINASG